MFSFYTGIFSSSSGFVFFRILPYLLLLFIPIYSFPSASSLDSQKFVPLSEIEVGDVFTARTRVENNVMHSFPVRVVSVVKMGSSKHPSIIAVSDDPLIMETRVAAGMSGSPVYDGERLVGAISFSWEFVEEPVMGITPIEEMLPIFDYQGKESHDLYGEEMGWEDPSGGGPWYDSSRQILSQYAVPEFYQFLKEESRRLPSGGAQLEKWITRSKTPSPPAEIASPKDTGISLPLMVSFTGPWGNFGTPPSGWEVLKKWLLPGIEVFPSFSMVSTAGGDEEDDTAPLVPGDYIGINLVRGDIEFSVFGTVTYTEGDSLLAFGHPFGLRGAIRLPLYRARTEVVVPLQSIPFKLGKLGREIGTVEQDREAGIMGKIGSRAPYLPIEVSLDTPIRNESYRFEVVNDKLYSTFLPGFIVKQIFYFEESIGRPTRLHYQVRADYTPTVSQKHSLILSNRIETDNNIMGVDMIASDLMNLMAMIRENHWEAGVVTNVAIRIVSRPGYGFMRMATVQSSATIYRPGEEIRFQVGFDRFRESRVYKEFTYTIPPEAKDGDYRLAISPALIRWIVERDLSEDPSSFKSLDRLSELWSSRPPLNQISIWSLEEKGNLLIKDRVYRHLPANQQKILLHSLHSEKDKVLGLRYRDYDLEETPMGFLSLPYRVQRNHKD